MSDGQRRDGGRRRRRKQRRPAGQQGQPAQQGQQGQQSQQGQQGQRQRQQPRQPEQRSRGQQPRGPGGSGDRRQKERGQEKGAGGRRARGGGGRGGGSGRRGRPEREPRLQYRSVVNLPEGEAPQCPICAKPVQDAVSALGWGDDRAAAHFDCVMESLRASRELRPDEQLCYLGGGSFGVVRFAKAEGSSAFTISERISFESTSHERPQWRRDLDSVRTGNQL